jgi:hypothetical protein
MRQTILLSLLLSCAAVPLFSQKLTFEGFVGGHYDWIPDASRSSENEYASLRVINDSQAVRTYILQSIKSIERYGTRPGYQLGTRTVWHLDQRTALMTGLTVTFRKFTRSAELTDVTTLSTRITTDTLRLSSGGGGGTLVVFDNDPDDLDINRNPPYNLVQLSIPLELRYALTPWLRVRAGVYLTTPLYSKRRVERIGIESYYKGSTQHIRFVKEEYDDTVGANLRRLVDGVSGSVEVPLSKKLHLELGVQKDMRSIMRPAANSTLFLFDSAQGYKARPLSLFLRAGYRLL